MKKGPSIEKLRKHRVKQFVLTFLACAAIVGIYFGATSGMAPMTDDFSTVVLFQMLYFMAILLWPLGPLGSPPSFPAGLLVTGCKALAVVLPILSWRHPTSRKLGIGACAAIVCFWAWPLAQFLVTRGR